MARFRWLVGSILALAGMAAAGHAVAQSVDADMAINEPDKASWKFFISIVSAVPNVPDKIRFETWASNEDTFTKTPIFPGALTTVCPGAEGAISATAAITPAASPKILNIPALQALAPGLQPHISPDGSEETRRNQATFDFIVCNQLYTKAGLRAAFASGRPISFPLDSMEVKANWLPIEDVNSSEYYVSTAADGKKYALVAFHIISKIIPDWTWATFEHRANLGRCDYIGCHDNFGAVVTDVQPNDVPGRPYNPCTKTEDVKKLFADAGLPSFWENYCLKGTQTDFVTPTGIPTHLGNSVTEAGFVSTSSCVSCHSRAAVDAKGIRTTGAGFIDPEIPELCPNASESACSPNGAPNPAWFWTNPGKPDQAATAMQTDFIWSIARHAIGP